MGINFPGWDRIFIARLLVLVPLKTTPYENSKIYHVILFIFFSTLSLIASPPQTTYHIEVDQFGYFPTSRKVAVIADPQTGFNAAETFNPGTGANQYQVRRWDDDVIVFTGTLQQNLKPR